MNTRKSEGAQTMSYLGEHGSAAPQNCQAKLDTVAPW